MPVLRQKKVFKDVMESNGKLSVSQAMRNNGYPATTASNPQQITRSKGWNELLKEYLPDDKLLKKHDEALEAIKINEFSGERLPDHNIRLKAVELGYKIKGKLQETGTNIIGDKQIVIMNFSKKANNPPAVPDEHGAEEKAP